MPTAENGLPDPGPGRRWATIDGVPMLVADTAEIDAGVIRKVADVLMGLFGNLTRDQAEYAATDLARRGLLTRVLPPAESHVVADMNWRVTATPHDPGATRVIPPAACPIGAVPSETAQHRGCAPKDYPEGPGCEVHGTP